MKIIKKLAALVMTFAVTASISVISTIPASAAEEKPENLGITIHYESTTQPYVYYWNSLPKNIETKYPGVKMTAESDKNWYTYTFKDVNKINLLFTDKDGNQLSKETTIKKAGEWWYLKSMWRPYKTQPTPVTAVDPREDSIYFVITTRFFDGDKGNNVHCWDDAKAGNPDTDPAWRGDFKGLAERLDYIKALGFSAIWITPVVENASGYDYHGYHSMDYNKVDCRYESDDFTYQDLIDAAHDKGMKIIQDVVWNHTGNFGDATLCPLFTKDYNADLSNLEDSLIPTDYLLKTNGLKDAAEYWAQKPAVQYSNRLMLMKNTNAAGNNTTNAIPGDADYETTKLSNSDVYNANNYWHSGYFQSLNWDDWTCKYAQIAGDCVDLNTENPDVADYTVKAMSKYIDMGVDGFRVDTVRHISRLSLNLMYNKQIKDAAAMSGNPGFYMFGEICCRYTQTWYRGHACESVPFYTWDETDGTYAQKWSWDSDPTSVNNNMNLTFDHYKALDNTEKQPTSTNALLDGIKYHKPDTSKASGMNAIDFTMHWSFDSASGAFGSAKAEDKYFNDSTYNVVYVDSHDYAPDNSQATRFTGGTATWAENMDLMFTFRGVPCLYYGSEVEFQKGEVIDVGPNAPLSTTGRAYFGDNLEGSVTANDFSEYTATGAVKTTLEKPLAKHVAKLNKIRRAVPALQKGQYTVSSNYVSGNMAYIRSYKDDDTNSLALVSISGAATFKNIPNGKYIDAVTGDVKTVSNGTLSVSSLAKSNMRVYVCCADGYTGIDGIVGEKGLTYLK